MKKIIKGRKYDTETAKVIASDRYPGPESDFGYWCEVLYQKPNKEFFLYGEGGIGSFFYRPLIEMEFGWGERIFPLTIEQAKKWLEKHSDVETYEELFGEVEE